VVTQEEFGVLLLLGLVTSGNMKVAVLNPDLILEYVEVVIGDYVYEIQFRVEKDGDENNPSPMDMDLKPEEDGNEEKEPEEFNKDNYVPSNETPAPNERNQKR
jgi:hypothetical protein